MKNAKKLVGLVLTVLILASLVVVPAVQAEGESAASTNLIANGGFESAETRTVGESEYKWPAKSEDGTEVWNANAGSGNYGKTAEGTDAYLTAETGYVRNGDYALKVTSATSENKRRIWQKVTGLTGGKWYEASVWVKTEESPETTFTSANRAQGAEIRVGKAADGALALTTKNGWFANSRCGTGNAALVDSQGNWTRLMVRWQQPITWEGDENYDNTVAYVVFEMGLLSTVTINYYFDDAYMREITDFNGGFEEVTQEKINDSTTVSFPAGLGMGGTEGNGGLAAEFAASSAEKHSGTYSLALLASENTPTYSRRATLFVPGIAPGTYRLTAYVKITGESSGAKILAGPDFINGDSTMWGNASGIKTAEEWTEKSFVFIVPEGYNYAYINMNSGKLEAGEAVYIDDISITQTTVLFKDADGTVLQQTKEGTITVRADFINQAAEAKTAYLIAATYTVNENNVRMLRDIAFSSGEAAANQAKTISTTIDVTDSNQIIQVMLYDTSIGSMKPLCETFVLPAGK